MNPLSQTAQRLKKFWPPGEDDERLDLLREAEQDLSGAGVIDFLLEFLSNPRSPEEADSIITTLLSGIAGMDALLSNLQDNQALIETLGREPFPGVLACMLYQGCESEDKSITLKIIELISNSDPECHPHALRGAIEIKDPVINSAALQAIRKISPGLIRPWLLDFLKIADEENARLSLEIMNENQDNDSIIPLAELYNKGKNSEIIAEFLKQYPNNTLDEYLSLNRPEFDKIRHAVGIPAPRKRFEDNIPKILIVDDAISIRIMTRTHLIREGFIDLKMASNGSEAIKMFRKYKPHIVLMDVMMPPTDGIDNGFEAAEIMRDIESSFHLIFVTSRANQKTVLRAKGLGANGLLAKPSTLESLRKQLHKSRDALIESSLI